MDKKIVKFDDTETKKYKFHQSKSPISLNGIDINKIVVSNKLPFGEKDDKKIDLYAYFFQK